MAKTKKTRISHLEYFGILKVEEITVVPEDMYVIDRNAEGTWLMSINRINHGNPIHVGTLDLRDVLCVAEKSHMANLKKEEFYDALERILGIDLVDKLYAMPDVGTVFSRFTAYSKQVAFRKEPYEKIVQRSNNTPLPSYRSQKSAVPDKNLVEAE